MAHQLQSPMKLQSNKVRLAFLVTFSQADMSIVPNRRKFAEIVVGNSTEVLSITKFFNGFAQRKNDLTTTPIST